MIMLSGVPRFAWSYSGTASPATSPGVAVTPGNGSKGSYVALASGANIANDVYGLWINVNTGSTSTVARPIRLDIGVDPAAGTSYVVELADILCGASAAYATGLGYMYYFPIFIKAGSSVGARAQGIETATLRVWAKFLGRPTNPDLVRAGQWAETVGSPSGGGGVSFTPGNSGAEGSWASLGTSVRACWWWQVSAQINNGTITALMYFIDLAWGDGTNKTMIQENIPLFAPGTSETMCFWNAQNGFADVPAGATLYVRGTCSGTTVTGLTALAHGIGG
jgi:hypothetical protein